MAIKEEEAQKTKKELLILWTDYFKPEHLTTFPDLHDTFWKAAKLCSACKVNIDQAKAEELMAAVEKIHGMFWQSKGRNDASGHHLLNRTACPLHLQQQVSRICCCFVAAGSC